MFFLDGRLDGIKVLFGGGRFFPGGTFFRDGRTDGRFAGVRVKSRLKCRRVTVADGKVDAWVFGGFFFFGPPPPPAVSSSSVCCWIPHVYHVKVGLLCLRSLSARSGYTFVLGV